MTAIIPSHPELNAVRIWPAHVIEARRSFH